jgi:methyl-accepting chemotaxis protein
MALSKILYPGYWLMRKMRFGVKLGLVTAVVLIPMLYVAVTLSAREQSDIAIAQSELQGVDLVDAASTVIRQLQTHRGQTNMVLSGNAQAQGPRDATRVDIKAARDTLDKLMVGTPGPLSGKAWQGLRDRIDGLAAALEGKSASDSFAQHTVLIDDMARFIYGLANESQLLFDPDPVTYALMDMSVSRLIPWAEQVAHLRGQGAGLLSQASVDPEGVVRVQTRLEALGKSTRDNEYALSLLAAMGRSDAQGGEAVKASTDFAALVRERLAPGAQPSDPQAFFASGTSAISAILGYQTVASQGVRELLRARLASAELQFWATVGGSLLTIVVLIYFMLAFNFSFLGDLRVVMNFMEETAKGNLRYKARLQGRDELSEMSVSMDAMVNNISVMVASVRSNAALVSNAGDALVMGNTALSDRTEQQAANLEETSASVQELSSTVADNANSAQAANQTAQGVRESAEQGARDMTQAIASVEAIEASTKRMDEIVSVIDGLAFQTNILALNAAVEAARAGESGRGFAVVATEVRSLAQRSAASAKEIRQLISASSAQVANGVAQIRTAGDNITGIVGGVRDVASSMSRISESSNEQSNSLGEITTAIRQLDEITQQNAAMVEQAVSQASALQNRASVLADAVSVFQLQQGSADEARRLVEQALAMRRSLGSRDAFVREVTLANNKLFDRDMYVFILDSSGRYLAFGGNPAKVGTRVQDVPGIDGDGLVASIVNQASMGPGWVEYDIVNPLSGKVQTKMSYVVKVDDVYTGCGVYKNLASA